MDKKENQVFEANFLNMLKKANDLIFKSYIIN